MNSVVAAQVGRPHGAARLSGGVDILWVQRRLPQLITTTAPFSSAYPPSPTHLHSIPSTAFIYPPPPPIEGKFIKIVPCTTHLLKQEK